MTRWLLLVALLVTVGSSQAQGPAPANDSIREQKLRADLFLIASDEMRGRLTDTPENRLASLFIKSRFERLGLKPAAAGDSYFQPYHLMTASLGGENALALPRGENGTLTLRLGEDFYPQSFSASGRVEGEVVFAGFGIRAPGYQHDDLGSADLRGKLVLVLDHEPGEEDPDSPFDGLVTAEVSRDMRKALYAQEAGAAAILFVTDLHNHPAVSNFSESFRNAWPSQPRRIPRYTLAAWTERVQIPAIQISPSLARILVAGTHRSLEELSASSEQRGGSEPVLLPGARVELTTSLERRRVSDRNVVAAIEGEDPQLKDEWVVVCAHYDHDGADGSRVFNGADDDGSGTVALLAIAEAFATAANNGRRPRRSILFAAWNSEERGLLGAWAYTESPLAPLDKTVAVLNMDMIGRNEEVPLGGGRRFRGLEIQTAESNANAVNIMGQSYSADLEREVKIANRETELELEMRYDNNASNLLRRSDQWPFLQNGVPALFFHTGLHPDYHTEFDVPERIQYQKMTRIARLVHQTSWNLAQMDGRPSFDKTTIAVTERSSRASPTSGR